MVSYFLTGSGISTRSIRQPCGTKTPKLIDRSTLIQSVLHIVACASGLDLHVGLSTSPVARALLRRWSSACWLRRPDGRHRQREYSHARSPVHDCPDVTCRDRSAHIRVANEGQAPAVGRP